MRKSLMGFKREINNHEKLYKKVFCLKMLISKVREGKIYVNPKNSCFFFFSKKNQQEKSASCKVKSKTQSVRQAGREREGKL